MTEWSRSGSDELVWKTWQQAVFVYHIESGQTHYLDELAAWILRKVIVAPISTSDLYAKMAGVYGVEITEELRESTDQTLETLENLGLIVSASANC